MTKIPHWTIICVALGAFLLPLMGGHLSIESGSLRANDSVLVGILTGDQAPFLTHFLLSLLFFIPICANLFAKKITHVVNLRISFWLALLGACIGVSIMVSGFPAVTIGVVLEWAMMSLAFFAVTLCCGRKQSSIPIVSFIGGSTMAAISGIAEYGAMKAYDPGYRISAMQIGPNQAGALFATGTILCLAMAFRFDRIARFPLVLGANMQSFALVLTQSKGAIVCLPIGVVVLIGGLLILKSAKPVAIIGGIVLPLIITGTLAVAMQNSAKTTAGGQAMTRVVSSGAEATQSQEFRKLLWSSAIDLAKERPYGWGMGTFWYESTRPGKITQTTLA
ncbi:MAG: O-antigen ligase family protein, partial [Armatimonadota bacterium]